MNILFLEQRLDIFAYLINILRDQEHIVYEAENFADVRLLRPDELDIFILGNPDWRGLSSKLKKEASELNQDQWPNYLAPFVWFRDLFEANMAKWSRAIFYGASAEILQEGKVPDIPQELTLIPYGIKATQSLLKAIDARW